MLLVDAAHKSGCGWKHLIDEDEDGLLGRQLDALANHVDELADSEVRRDQVLLLVDGGNVRLFNLLADDLCNEAVSVFVLGEVGSCSSLARTGMRSVYFWRMRSASA